jgi:hypothetical protein
MTDVYRVYVELPNGAKFRAHGVADEVRTDLDHFYELLIAAPTPSIAIPTINSSNVTNSNGVAHHNDNGNGDGAAINAIPTAADGLDTALLDRLFSKDRNGTVSLRALPHGENHETNALVALIYGAAKLANEPQVTGSRLMKAATQSGLHQVDRIDRSLSSAIGQYVTTAGFKKGRRYGLTNPGIRRAEEILAEILG